MKISVFCTLALMVGLLFIAQPAAAQSNDPALLSSIDRLNATPAVRSPDFKENGYIFSTRILDTNRQLVGYVRDMLIYSSGEMAYVDGEITRARSGSPRRLYAADNVTFLEDISSWEVPLENFNDNISRNNLFELQAMVGAEVKDISGGWVGKVKYVLMDKEARIIKGLVLNEVPGASRYDDVAIPFMTEYVTIMKRYDRIEFRLDRAMAQTVKDFARERF